MPETKKIQNNQSAPWCIAIGALITVITSLLGVLCVALLLESEHLPEGSLGYGVLTVTLVSSFVGSYVAVKMSESLRILIALGVGSVYYVLLLSVTALLFDGRYQGIGATALVVFSSSVCAILLRTNKKSTAKRRVRKYRNR